jgi:hypothetical protein
MAPELRTPRFRRTVKAACTCISTGNGSLVTDRAGNLSGFSSTVQFEINFQWHRGNVDAKNPDQRLIAKMVRRAHRN